MPLQPGGTSGQNCHESSFYRNKVTCLQMVGPIYKLFWAYAHTKYL